MKKLLFIIIGMLLLGCSEKPANQLIVYLEKEDGVDPYKTRIIVAPDFVRFDEGENSETYLLFDRKARVAYSVNNPMKSTMLVRSKDTTIKPPFELKYSDKILDDLKDAPRIKNIKPVHRQFLTNEQVCFDIISAQGLMPEAVQAMKEFHQTLATDSASTFNTIPADMHDPCLISMSTFAPTRHLQYGFPVQEWKPGYSRSLINFDENYSASPSLFKVPSQYFTYSVEEFREGRVDLTAQKVYSKKELEELNKQEKSSETQKEE